MPKIRRQPRTQVDTDNNFRVLEELVVASQCEGFIPAGGMTISGGGAADGLLQDVPAARFQNGVDSHVAVVLRNPSRYRGGELEVTLRWTSQTTTGDVDWNISAICMTEGVTYASGDAVSAPITENAPSSTRIVQFTTPVYFTVTSACDMVSIEIERQGTADTMAGAAFLFGMDYRLYPARGTD